jgi:hypothetical protein
MAELHLATEGTVRCVLFVSQVHDIIMMMMMTTMTMTMMTMAKGD